MTTPDVTVTVTRYTVSALPEDHISHHNYAITVEDRGNDRWAVMHGRFCLGTDGVWEWELLPSERGDEWLAEHRFGHDTALRLAKEQAPLVTVNGRTATEVLARARATP